MKGPGVAGSPGAARTGERAATAGVPPSLPRVNSPIAASRAVAAGRAAATCASDGPWNGSPAAFASACARSNASACCREPTHGTAARLRMTSSFGVGVFCSPWAPPGCPDCSRVGTKCTSASVRHAAWDRRCCMARKLQHSRCNSAEKRCSVARTQSDQPSTLPSTRSLRGRIAAQRLQIRKATVGATAAMPTLRARVSCCCVSNSVVDRRHLVVAHDASCFIAVCGWLAIGRETRALAVAIPLRARRRDLETAAHWCAGQEGNKSGRRRSS